MRTLRPPHAGVKETGAAEVVIQVEIRPKTLKELFTAVAMTKGADPGVLLEGCGLTKGKAKSMASGSVVYPEAVMPFIRQSGVTAADFFKLMTAPQGNGRTPEASTGARRGGRPRRNEAQA